MDIVDSTKGFLIALVLLGHLIQGTLADNLVRYIIYSFHMPLFFFVAGFLLRVGALADLSIRTYSQKYLLRVGVPWVICVAVYFLITNHPLDASVRNLLRLFAAPVYRPYYHLWFIPAFLSYVVIAAAWVKIRRANGLGLLLAGALVVSMLDRVFESALSKGVVVGTLQYALRPYNLFFFCLGIWVRTRPKAVETFQSRMFLFGLALAPVMFLVHGSLVESLLWLVLNTSLCIGVYSLFTQHPEIRVPVLGYLGKRSLYVYLLHVFGLLFVKALLPAENSPQFLAAGSLSYAAVILLVYITDRVWSRGLGREARTA